MIAALIGDPTLLGWGTTFAYLAAAGLLVWNARTARRRGEAVSFWWAASLMIFALGLNKQLDLQTVLGEAAKTWVLDNGLYEQRRMLQLAFVATLALVSGLVIWILRKWIARAGRAYKLTALGLCLCVCFVVVRAASLHGLDRIFGSHGLSRIVGAILELTALALVMMGAVRWRRRVTPEAEARGAML